MSSRPGGFTLVELLIVLAFLALLLGILAPSLSSAKEQARLCACSIQMARLGTGLAQYAAANNNRLPPFAYSGLRGNLPLSGHWGGWSQANDPDCFGRWQQSLENVNLWRLVADGLVAPGQLICPAADEALSAGTASYFPYSFKSSTYCLRMLYSEDLFASCPDLASWHGQGLLGIYTAMGSGKQTLGNTEYNVPFLRLDLTYCETDPSSGQRRMVDLAGAALVSDTFWYRQRRQAATARPGLNAYEVRADWCHGQRFNVLFGGGAVRTARDDGTVSGSCAVGDALPPDDGLNYASYAVRVWRYFEDHK